MTAAPDPRWARGFDVSHWTEPLDWSRARAAGYTFVGAKASEGTSYVDPTFKRSQAAIRNHGFLLGIYYHYAKATSPLSTQLATFLKTIGKLARNEVAALDLEEWPATRPVQVLEWIGEWFKAVEAATERRALLYCKRVWFELGNPDPPWAKTRELWYPRYRRFELGPGELPAPWAPDRWLIWQHTDGGETGPKLDVPGVGRCDANVWHGTEDDLVRWVGGAC